MISFENPNATKLHSNCFKDPLSDETTDEKKLGLNANHMMCREPLTDDLNNPSDLLENERSMRLNEWADFKGYTYQPTLQAWLNGLQEFKTEEDLENELSIFQSPESNSTSTTSTTTTSSVESVVGTRLPISISSNITNEMEELEKAVMGFEFDPISGNWINDYGISLSPEELSFNIEESRNREKLSANLSGGQFAEETFRNAEKREENEARLAKEMVAGLGCSLAYPNTEFLPISVKLEILDLYHQQIKARYHADASSLIDAGKLCGYVYRSQLDQWEHYRSGKILDSDRLLKKFWIKGKTQLKNAGEF